MNSIQRYILLIALLLVAGIARAQQQVTVRVCTYNVLDYLQPTDNRKAAVEHVLGTVHPDILVIHELANDEAFQYFWVTAKTLGSNYTWAPFTNGPDTDNGMFFDSTKVIVVSYSAQTTPLRNIDSWILAVRGTTDTIVVLGCHLKPGDDSASVAERAVEAGYIREGTVSLPKNYHYLLAGDLNVYTSSETAYMVLTDSTPPAAAGRFRDPIDRPGNWHNNADFADIHTQSPRLRQLSDWIGGGLDDRFDFVLVSPSLTSHVVPGSYTAFGNDGHHFDDSINVQPNAAVDSVTAQALYDASDHLPVYVDLVFTKETSAVEERKHAPGEMDLSSRDK